MSAVDDLHPELASLLGTVIHDRYRVEELLGRGGMGAVFKARHLGLERDVAIKVLHPGLSADDTMGKRFVREAQSVSRLDHPNCVRVSDFGSTDNDVQYLVMELLEGQELEAELGSPWSPAHAVDTTLQILEALEHAHHFGIVHRDLKPENVFLTTDFRGQPLVKLVDFGIAKLIGDASPTEQLTRQGMVFGTPRYMSPEQASGGKLDERTDLYAVGLLLYEMLAGRPPFVADEVAVLLRMQILAPPPALPNTIPRPLAAVVSKLLEKTRKKRYTRAREAIDALTEVRAALGGAPPTVPTPAAASLATGPTKGPAEALSTTGPTAPASDATPPVTGSSVAFVPAPNPAAPAPPPPPGHPPSMGGVPVPPAAPVAPPTLPPLGPSASNSAPMPAAASNASSSLSHPVTSPNAATQASPATVSPSASQAETHQTRAVHPQNVPPATRPHRPYLPWVIGAAGILLALMAFGAGQALRNAGESDTESEAQPGATGVDPSIADTRFDQDCSDGVCGCDSTHACELACGDHCSVRCTNAARCELALGDLSWAYCDKFGTCEVACSGDCRVTCPQGGCQVTCPHGYDDEDDDDKKNDKKDDKKKKKKNKVKFKDKKDPPERPSAQTCPDGTLVCGSCDW